MTCNFASGYFDFIHLLQSEVPGALNGEILHKKAGSGTGCDIFFHAADNLLVIGFQSNK